MATINTHDTESYLNDKLTVLIVDDSKVIRLALNKILKNDFIVIQANDGEDAWDKLQAHDEIVGVFSDVSMPNLDGFGLLDRVRTAPESRISELPFVIITANDDDPDFSSKVSNAGGNDLITKPFKTDEIKACIQNHIHAEPRPAAAVVSEEAATLADQEVAEILGFDGIENDETQTPVAEEYSTQAKDFTYDDDFFETSSDSLEESKLDLTDVTANPESKDYETLSEVDLDLDLDLDLEFADTQASDDDFVFTIDEEFLNSSLESEHKEHITDTHEHLNSVPSELPLTQESHNQSETQPVSAAMELSLEEITTTPEQQQEGTTAIEGIAISLETARQHATEVAQSSMEQVSEVSVETKARFSTEREQIRARLQQIREQEKEDIANIRASRKRSGNSTSLFSKLGRIISGLFGFRKK